MKKDHTGLRRSKSHVEYYISNVKKEELKTKLNNDEINKIVGNRSYLRQL
jgi:hypothetical protein